ARHYGASFCAVSTGARSRSVWLRRGGLVRGDPSAARSAGLLGALAAGALATGALAAGALAFGLATATVSPARSAGLLAGWLGFLPRRLLALLDLSGLSVALSGALSLGLGASSCDLGSGLGSALGAGRTGAGDLPGRAGVAGSGCGRVCPLPWPSSGDSIC